MTTTKHDAQTTLDVEGLTKQFGGLLAVDRVTFQVHQNTVHGLIGPNGAGKTTLFNMISGVLPATAGSIRLLDEPLDELPTWERTRRGVARTFQNIRMFADMRVVEKSSRACTAASAAASVRSHSEWIVQEGGTGRRGEGARATRLRRLGAGRGSPCRGSVMATSADSRSRALSRRNREFCCSTNQPLA
jgi:branched-chain amino acid transport system ATP-binding protein